MDWDEEEEEVEVNRIADKLVYFMVALVYANRGYGDSEGRTDG